MQFAYNFKTANQGLSVSLPKPSRVGIKMVDRDGLPLEGETPPFLTAKPVPFQLSFSHETPADIYLQSKDFFELEGDHWERANVFSSRNCLRNLARCLLFPVDDYYCRDFVIDAAFLKGRLFLQRHPDTVISEQQEGYGVAFERAMATGTGNPDAYACHEFVTYPVGEHAILMRAETDCFDNRSKAAIGLSTKKLKKNKRGGYYDLGSSNYYQEHWLQMVLSGTSVLIVGALKEDPRIPDVATVDQLHRFTADDLTQKGQLTRERQQEVFNGLSSILSWIKMCFAKAVAARMCPADKLAQARITFSKVNGDKVLMFTVLADRQHVEFLSEEYVGAIAEL
jgi:hypothetical protein